MGNWHFPSWEPWPHTRRYTSSTPLRSQLQTTPQRKLQIGPHLQKAERWFWDHTPDNLHILAVPRKSLKITNRMGDKFTRFDVQVWLITMDWWTQIINNMILSSNSRANLYLVSLPEMCHYFHLLCGRLPGTQPQLGGFTSFCHTTHHHMDSNRNFPPCQKICWDLSTD